MEKFVNDELDDENRNNLMRIDMIQKLTMNKWMKEQMLKVQPIKKLMIHIKEKNVISEKKIHGISEGDKLSAKIVGDDVDLVE